jgi:hypothetical protein
LGVGRHASVFLAACRTEEANEASWRLCAAKRMNADRDAQVGGFREAYILTKLYDGGRGPSSIIRLLALKDEQASDRHLPRPIRSDHARSASASEADTSLSIDTGSALHRALSAADMSKGGSHSTPSSPVVATDPAQALLAAPAASVRRSISLRESSNRVAWVRDGNSTEIADPPRLVLALECVASVAARSIR